MTEELTRSIFRNGRFVNPWPGFELPTAGKLMRLFWQFARKDNSNVPSAEELDRTLPVHQVDVSGLVPPKSGTTRVFWIGHASVLTQMDGVTVLFDPIFSQRCAPFQFAGPKRYRPVPCNIDQLPPITACCISHDHYDHLDLNSIKGLNEAYPSIQWFVPLGTRPLLTGVGVKGEQVTELDWWEEAHIGSTNVKVALTPAQHMCKRTAFDTCKRLWGSWCLLGPSQRFFFGGDTAYCDAFRQIGTQYGPFDVAAIPIGAYEPRWFMRHVHVDPTEAVQLHMDIKSRQSVGIHWGTFVLTTEHYLEPRDRLPKELSDRGLDTSCFITMEHGEVREFGTTTAKESTPPRSEDV